MKHYKCLQCELGKQSYMTSLKGSYASMYLTVCSPFCSSTIPATAHLNLHLVKGLSIVYANNTSNHLRDDNHVPEVCFDASWLLKLWTLLLGLA